MPVSLGKGQRVSLDGSLKLVHVGLGWKIDIKNGADFGLDASVFLLGPDEKVSRDEDLVFYNNLRGRGGAVVHTGGNLSGSESACDAEAVVIDFSRMPDDVHKIVVAAAIFEAAARRQNLGQVYDSYVRVAKMADEFDPVGETVLRFDVQDKFSSETALVFCEIYRRNGGWKFNAVGGGVNGGLYGLCARYGIDAA